MALWSNSSLNTNRVSLAFSNMAWNNIVDITRRKYGLWYAALGKMDKGAMVDNRLTFKEIQEVTGYKFEVTFQGKIPTYTKVAKGTPELQRVNYTYDSNIFGGYQFDLCQYYYKHPIPKSDYDQLRGNEMKTENYLNAIVKYCVAGLDNQISDDIHANVTQTETSIAGTRFIVADDNTYAFDRTDAANSKFQSQIDNASSAQLTLDMLALNQNKCIDGGGNPKLGLADIARYTDIQRLVQDQAFYTSHKDWDDFGGKWVGYGNTVYCMDNRTTANTVYHLDPEYWFLVRNQTPLNTEAIILDPTLVGGYCLPVHLYLGVGCVLPSGQGRIHTLL